MMILVMTIIVMVSRAGKIARGSRANSSLPRLGSARLVVARELRPSRAEPVPQARCTIEPSRASSPGSRAEAGADSRSRS
jgi:hypothetical protein